MKLEAIAQPVLIRWRTGQLQLMPGQPVDVPDEHALKILAKVPGKVRIVGKPDWLSAWRQLAAATDGLDPTDPRLPEVLTYLSHCDDAFAREDWPGFVTAAAHIVAVMAAKSQEPAP